MRIVQVIAVFLAGLTLLSAQSIAIDAPFDGLVGQANALVLTGPVGDPFYTEQVGLLTEAKEWLIAHDIVVIHFHDAALDTLQDLSAISYTPTFRKTGRKRKYLQSQLRTDDDLFSVVLVGKTGETLKVWTEVTDPAAIFAVLDKLQASAGDVKDSTPLPK